MKLYLNLFAMFLGIIALGEWSLTPCLAHDESAEISSEVSEIENIEVEVIVPQSNSATEQLSPEEEAINAEPSSQDTESSKSDKSQAANILEDSSNEPTNNFLILQCPIQETIVKTNTENSEQELVSDSEITDREKIVNTSSSEENSPEILQESAKKTEADTEPTRSEVEITESPNSAEAETAATEVASNTIDCLNPEEMTHYKRWLIADNLYRSGNKVAAAQIYQEQKKPWSEELDPSITLPEAHDDPTQLGPAAAVYWRIYQEGKKQGLESKILTPLELLVAQEPQFVPGHLSYAESLLSYDREEESLDVLENAVSLYPKNIQLLREKIAADVRTKQWLDASISSRQFALFNPELPQAAEFAQLADQYLEEYKSDIREKLAFNAIGNAITGAVGFALTGNIFGPISAIDTTWMLLKGESNLGEKFAKQAQKYLPMVENEAILNYVREVGDKVVEASGRDDFQFEFYVVMDENINAFALPGGKIFVNLGVILNTDSEAELAGLLAHEAAHAVLSHGFQLATRGSLMANITQYIPYVGGTAGNLIVLNYSRDMEKQADLFGTRMLAASGYAADGVRNLMAKLHEFHEQDEEYIEPPVWLSTHPNTEERVRYMEQFIVDNQINRYAYEGVEKHYQMKLLAKKIWREYAQELEAEDQPDLSQSLF